MSNLAISDYNEKKDAWFSPKHVVDNFEVLRGVFRDNLLKHDFKKARELFAGAITLLGAYELSSQNKYFLQLNKQSSSPDIIAAKQTERTDLPILLELAQIELTEFEEHAKTDELVDFLKTTKLSPRKAYSNKTMIACLINRMMPVNRQKIAKQLSDISPTSSVYIIGRKDRGGIGDFVIFQAYPKLTRFIKYNVDKTASKYSLPSPVRLSLGMDRKIIYKNARVEYISVFEMFGLDEEKIKRKYDADLKRFIPNPARQFPH